MSGGLGRVGVIGLGLIGGGIALDLRRSGHDVVGFDRDPAVRRRAGELGVATTEDLGELLAGADLAVVAVPLGSIGRTVAAVRAVAADLLVTDVGSVKDPDALGLEPGGGAGRFIGGHPMGGSERSGIDAARPGLFDGVAWFLTPSRDSGVGDLLAAVRLVQALAAEPILVTPETHDRYVALLSHVPHLLAYGLNAAAMDVLGPGLHGLGGGSFRDTTRVASSDPGFWAGTLHANRAGVSGALRLLRGWVDDAEALLEDGAGLEAKLAAARRPPAAPRQRGPERVVLPPAHRPLGDAACLELCRLGAAGFSVSAIEVGPDGSTSLRLDAR